MRIGINLLFMIPNIVGGTETYAQGILYGLSQVDKENDYFVFLNKEAAGWALPESPNFHRVITDIAATSRGRRYLYEQSRFPFLVRRHKIDVLHSMGYVGPYFIRCKHIATIHDLNFIGHGDKMSWRKRLVYKHMLDRIAGACDRIIAVSQFSKNEMVKYLPSVRPDKVEVIHEAADYPLSSDGRPADTPLQLKEPYIVAFSSKSGHKNIELLLRAYAEIKGRSEVHLVLIGHLPGKHVLFDELETLGISENVIFTGFITEGQVRQALGGARLFVFPSLYEGFGLPILEAQREGVCVLSSEATALPEVGGKGALYFNPHSVDDLREKLLFLLENPGERQSLVRHGYANLSKFSWTKAGLETLSVYNKTKNKS